MLLGFSIVAADWLKASREVENNCCAPRSPELCTMYLCSIFQGVISQARYIPDLRWDYFADRLGLHM